MCIVLCTVHLPPRVSLVVAHLSGSSVRKVKGALACSQGGAANSIPVEVGIRGSDHVAVAVLGLVVSWSCAWLMGFLRVCVYA